MEGIEPFDPRSLTAGPGCDDFRQIELYAFFKPHVRVAQMVRDKPTIRRSGSRKFPFTWKYLRQNEFVRLVGPYFARSLEVEIDLGSDDDFPEVLERLSGFPVPPSYISCRVVPKPPLDENGKPQFHGVGNLHLTWLLKERVQWKKADDGSKHWTRDMYDRVQKQITELLHGDRRFKHSLTRSPFAQGDDVEYRTQVLDLMPVSLFDLDKASQQYDRLLHDAEIEPVEFRDEKSRLKTDAGEKRQVQTLGGEILLEDGRKLHAPVVDAAGVLQRNEWLFEHGRFWAYAKARELVAAGERLDYHAILDPLVEELMDANRRIPGITASKEALEPHEVKDIAMSIAGFVSSRYVPSTGGKRAKSRYAVARGRKAQELHPELRDQLQPEIGRSKGQEKIRAKNVGASQERQRRVLRVVDLLRESKTRREIRDVLMSDLELESLSLETVKGYVREARKILNEK